MIQSTEIRKIARKTGLPAGLIEKDYANTLILKEVYKHNFFDKKQIRHVLKLKSIEKNVELNTETVFNQKTRDELVGYWEKSLGLFTKDLPDYDDVHTDVQEYVCKLMDGE